MTRSGAFFLRLSAEERAELQRQATAEGRSLADLIRVRCGLPAARVARVPKPPKCAACGDSGVLDEDGGLSYDPCECPAGDEGRARRAAERAAGRTPRAHG